MRLRAVRARCRLLLLLVLPGCSIDGALRRIAPPEVDGYARAYVAALSTGTAEQLAAQFTPRLVQEPGVIDSLRHVMAQFVPIGALDSIEIVGANAFFQGGGARRVLSYQVHGAGGWALAQIVIVDAGGQRWVDALHVERLSQPLEETNGFARNLRVPQVVMLLWTLATVAFSLGAMIVVARTPMPKRWWWALFAAIGVGKLGMNWTTAATFTQLLSVQLFSGSAQRIGLAGPWVITFSFPVGAIVALQRRRRALQALVPVKSPGSASATSDIGPPAA